MAGVLSRHGKARGRHRRPPPPFPTGRFLLLMSLGAFLAAGLSNSPEASTAQPAAAVAPAPVVQPPAPASPAPAPATFATQAVMAISKKPQRVPPLTGAVGLTSRASALAKYLQDAYPGVASISGVRSDPLPDHPSGHAIDVMVYNDKETGDAVLHDVLGNAERFGVRYAIWRQQMYRPSGYVGWMGNRGTPTLNHYDHVHITVW